MIFKYGLRCSGDTHYSNNAQINTAPHIMKLHYHKQVNEAQTKSKP